MAYSGGLSISVGVTLLQIWAYKHISVFWPVVDWELVDDMPYVYSYRGVLAQGPLGYVTYFHHQLDTLDQFIWRPYIDCPGWEDDEVHLPYYR